MGIQEGRFYTWEYLSQHGQAIKWIEYTGMYQSHPALHNLDALHIAAYCPNLMRFEGLHSHESAVLLKLAECCPLLEEIAGFGECTDETILALAAYCTRLKRVAFSSPDLGEDCLIELVRRNPDLRAFDSNAVGAGTEVFVRELARNCPLLTDIALSSVQFDDASILYLLKMCKNLSAIALSNGNLFPFGIDVEPAVNTIMRTLMVGNASFQTAQVVHILQVCPGLTNLNLLHCDLIRFETAKIGALCPKLEALSVYSDFDFDANLVLQDISAHCADLRVLVVPNNEGTTTAALVEVATRCPLLQEVDIRGSVEVSDGFLDALAQRCGGMKVLHVDGCALISDVGVRAVMQGCAGLLELTVRDCTHVSDELKEEIGRRYPVKLLG
jgi:hypothetical protein